MEKQDFWILFGLIVMLDISVIIHGAHLKLHDEMLLGDLDRRRSEALGG